MMAKKAFGNIQVDQEPATLQNGVTDVTVFVGLLADALKVDKYTVKIGLSTPLVGPTH